MTILIDSCGIAVALHAKLLVPSKISLTSLVNRYVSLPSSPVRLSNLNICAQLLWYTSVKVTPQAQANYFAKNPNIPRPSATAVSTSTSTPSAASGSSNASSASASGSSPNTSVSSAAAVRDLTAEKKARAKLNAAAVNYAASNASVKIMNLAKTG